MEYVYRKNKPKKRYHIKTPYGTACKMENACNGVFVRKLDTVSDRPPQGRKLCAMCDNVANGTPLLPDQDVERSPWEREATWE